MKDSGMMTSNFQKHEYVCTDRYTQIYTSPRIHTGSCTNKNKMRVCSLMQWPHLVFNITCKILTPALFFYIWLYVTAVPFCMPRKLSHSSSLICCVWNPSYSILPRKMKTNIHLFLFYWVYMNMLHQTACLHCSTDR